MPKTGANFHWKLKKRWGKRVVLGQYAPRGRRIIRPTTSAFAIVHTVTLRFMPEFYTQNPQNCKRIIGKIDLGG